MKTLLACLLVFFSSVTYSDVHRSFNQLKSDPKALAHFIAEMPKGGELHFHLAGGVTPVYLLELAQKHRYHFCHGVVICDAGEPADRYLNRHYQKAIDAWSMPARLVNETPQEHFFATFLKFWPIVYDNRGALLAEVLRDAERQHLHYLEIIEVIDNNQAALLSHSLPWNGQFEFYRQALIKKGIQQLVNALPSYLDHVEQEAKQHLGCTKSQRKACRIPVRYQMVVLREQEPAAVFAELTAAFELAKRDPRVVAINLVQAEDGKISLRDYRLHMNMIRYFRRLYPTVKVSLHAGELRPQRVAKQDLDFHITEAVNTALADRIGHGTTIVYEKALGQLLETLKQRDVLIEVNLSSNYQLLELPPERHPLPWLIKHGVPVTLSTDDPGILGIDLNHEYQLAVTTFHMDYKTVQWLNRNALHYSFLTGQSLWQSTRVPTLQPACQGSRFDRQPSAACQQFLMNNEKARVQWAFERDLAQFEARFNKK